MTTNLINAEFSSDLVPSPVEYAVFLPDAYEETEEDFPLLFFLHGGGGDRNFLTLIRPLI